MRYARARLEESRQELAYRVYMTDSVYYQAHGKCTDKRWVDWIENRHEPVETRTAEEVKAEIQKKWAASFGGA